MTKLDQALIMPEFVRLFCDVKFRGDCNKEDPDLISFVAWWKFNNPMFKSHLIHIPNEKISNPQGRIKDKKKGVLTGAPDVLILLPMNGFCGFIMECKRKNPAESLKSAELKAHFELQKTILNGYGEQGYFACAAFGLEQMKGAWLAYVNHQK